MNHCISYDDRWNVRSPNTCFTTRGKPLPCSKRFFHLQFCRAEMARTPPRALPEHIDFCRTASCTQAATTVHSSVSHVLNASRTFGFEFIAFTAVDRCWARLRTFTENISTSPIASVTRQDMVSNSAHSKSHFKFAVFGEVLFY